MSGKAVDVTPNMWGNRGTEIGEWLMIHGKDVSHYAILDDKNSILQEQEPHFIWINPEVGITEGNALQAIMTLNNVV